MTAFSPFICPSCTIRRLSASRHLTKARLPGQGRAQPNRRKASTLASSTAINATKEVKPGVRDLHQALAELQVRGANHVNLSRLRLALNSLEGRDAVVRVAGRSLTLLYLIACKSNTHDTIQSWA